MRDEDLIDRRRFADLVEEALAIIRARCPDWTDHSPGDPGITLVEVYAWLTETMLYRLNRLPGRLHLELLKLLGVLPLPAAAAETRLQATRAGDDLPAAEWPEGLRVSDPEGKVIFSTCAPLRFVEGETAAEVPAVQAEPVEGELLGLGTGEAGRSFTLRRGPVPRPLPVAETLRVGVEWPGGDEVPPEARTISLEGRVFVLWDEVPGFRPGQPPRAFVADRTTGRITFAPLSGVIRAGDGGGFAIPPRGAEIRAWYLVGGGRAGNVPPGTLTQLRQPVPGLSITNPARATGGEDAETPAAFVARGSDAVRMPDSAITASDFERVALAAGGVARAGAEAELALWSFGRPGVVEVRIVPQVSPDPETGAVTEEMLAAHRQEPLRERVEKLLDAHRPIGVRVAVRWTRCRPVAVEARIAASPSEDIPALERRVTRRLNALLSPLGGWPAGKALRISEVYEAILAEPGVRYAEGVSLSTTDRPEGPVGALVADPNQPRTLYALMGDGLYRSLDDAQAWERVAGGEGLRPRALATDPDLPGFLALALERPDGQTELRSSPSCGEEWTELEVLPKPVHGLAVTTREGRRWLVIAGAEGCLQRDLATPGLQAVEVGPGGTGFYAAASATSAAGTGFVALAARSGGGVWLSSRCGAGGSFQQLPGSQNLDIRALAFARDGGQLWLWAAVWAEAGQTGTGPMRIAVRADGLDPQGWQRFPEGWKGGSCMAFDVAGGRVAAGTRDAGVLMLDAGGAKPAWRASRLTSGLPIDNDRARLLPVAAVALRPGGRTLLAGTAQGLSRGDPEDLTFTRIEGRRFTDRLPLPPGWLPCAGAHRLQFGAEPPGGDDATG
ncbi:MULTISPECIES: baseplate J/gp47 family protein [unclassified Paracoccus (in: a-proteobacteria)]|uniref:baseplate J/gp47 family protein n=1 Tax=unclassified Paracoccus (in: a-proteobacteria) TaxID=2688777 RepID=UPI001603D04A|nr:MULTISPECIES: baseplate J/gp47 family protein [unclassified Paracoccus (in: a-proteobacteria)]MBB1492344.1 baseplate J/gp47 family protein [Paracoccus sp. MC1854]MBB1498423.1 baseplate J/gp47 family protein [Paracoccus sp. MC1862]QQO46660.1 baseplate J/gp47 family protein [Paracoccus sp. MC1862]